MLADSSGTSIWTIDNINVGFASGSIDIQGTNPLINLKTGASESFDTRIAQITNGLGFYTGGNGATVLGMLLDQNRNLLLDPAGAGGAPAAPLHVKGGTADYPIKVESTDGTAGVQLSDNATTGVVGIAAVGDVLKALVGGAAKLEVSATGIEVTGNIVIDTNPSGHSVDEAIRIDDGGSTVDRALQLFEYHDAGARYHSISFNTHTTSNGSNFVYTQGNYGGSSSMLFANDGSLSLFTDAQVTSGSTTNITPSERLRITQSGNVGIGTATPAYSLQVNGDVRLHRMLTNDGTASLPSFTFGGDANTGCLLYTSPSPRDGLLSRMPSSA